MSESSPERAPLLRPSQNDRLSLPPKSITKLLVGGLLVVTFTVATIILASFDEKLHADPKQVALSVLQAAPVIDGHIDLPATLRWLYKNDISSFDLHQTMPGHVDIPRLRKGHVGGFFWSVFVPCEDDGPDFLVPTNRVRDTLEQIDVSKLLIHKYSDTFMLATGTADVKEAFRVGKIASLIGVEGGHQLGNSLAVLRQYHSVGARYLTLTHSCNNAFADSAGVFTPVTPVHGGLSAFGKELVLELNRLGMLVDLSHVSDDTAIQAIHLSLAPVILSHSAARALHNLTRNVPDHILNMIGTSKGKKDAVVMVNFSTDFLTGQDNATLADVADHIEHIGRVAGREHVGIGSDFDGIPSTPKGLEDASTYPALFIELRRRGWTRGQLAGLASANFLRVLAGVEETARRMKQQSPSMARYRKRVDL
ncbi:Membrane dipeptidase (Peptidase family M19) [Ceratobasidium sp. AG-Ba]|nr:Membrane dipeptidase (Peptidase family M19) [Ceratobasidium sp. AG-Ba]